MFRQIIPSLGVGPSMFHLPSDSMCSQIEKPLFWRWFSSTASLHLTSTGPETLSKTMYYETNVTTGWLIWQSQVPPAAPQHRNEMCVPPGILLLERTPWELLSEQATVVWPSFTLVPDKDPNSFQEGSRNPPPSLSNLRSQVPMMPQLLHSWMLEGNQR